MVECIHVADVGQLHSIPQNEAGDWSVVSHLPLETIWNRAIIAVLFIAKLSNLTIT